MTVRSRRPFTHIRRAVAMAALAVPLVVAVAIGSGQPASAATDDSFTAVTSDGCGALDFVDYGPGEEGGGNNDDYLVIHDYCADGHGIHAFAGLNMRSFGPWYNGNGLNGPAVIWDPS